METGHFAAWNGHEATARLLLERGADIEAKEVDGWTALQFAGRKRHKVISQLLLDRRADIEANKADGAAALPVTAESHPPAASRSNSH